MTRHWRVTGLVAAAWMLAGSMTSAAEPAAPNVWKQYTVESPSTGKIERFWVGLPATIKPGAAAADARRYPVIYFLPGLRDNDDTWKAALDPHLARFEIIAVCPSVGGATWFMNSPRQPWMKWGDYLTDDLRAFIETHYPASPEKGQRGVCGISSGGHGAFYEALIHPDLYGSVSVLSGAMDLRGYAGAVGLDYWIGPRTGETTGLYADRSCVVLAARHEGPLPFELFLDAGDKDGALPQMQQLTKVLDARKLPYKWFLGQGSHSWTYWNSRAADHVAWFNEQFEKNRRGGLMTEKAPLDKAPALKVLNAVPDVALSEAADKRLRAAWTPPAGGRNLFIKGLPSEGAPLSMAEPKMKEVRLTGALTVPGQDSGLLVYRVTATVQAPVDRGGTLSIETNIRNGQEAGLFSLPPLSFAVPAGPANREVALEARLVVEMKAPDPLRGGIVAAMQAFDPAGKPLGDPVIGKVRPGTLAVEQWPFAPVLNGEWVFSLTGDKALPLAAVKDFKVEVEP